MDYNNIDLGKIPKNISINPSRNLEDNDLTELINIGVAQNKFVLGIDAPIIGIENQASTAEYNPISGVSPETSQNPLRRATRSNWMIIAEGELGIRETRDGSDNPRILEYQKVARSSQGDEIPWCGSFVAWVMAQAGYPIVQGSPRAKNWLNYGVPGPAEYGAIVVFNRFSGGRIVGGHVGFFVEEKGDRITVLGGNQSNAVTKSSSYRKAHVLGYRWPK